MTEAAHSYYSASGFEAAMLCPGKPVIEQGKPNNSNAYAREGTAAHQVLEWCLRDGMAPLAFLGRIIDVDGDRIEVTDEMADHIDWCLGVIEEYAAGNVVLPETRVNYSDAIGVEHDQAWGTADVIIARDDELIVMDLKYGRGVEVSPKGNPQMMLYGLGALAQCDGIMGDFKRVRLVVLQPRVSRKPSEWDCTVDDLRKWAATEAWNAVEERQQAAQAASLLDEGYLRPGEKQCRFCRAKATCPALRDEVASTAFNSTPASPDEFAEQSVCKPGATGFTSAEWVAACLSQVDLIEDWCKSIRAEAERRLLAGEDVPGYKVVAGKRGARQWADTAAAEELLRKTFRLPVEKAYDLKLISPTTAEKLFKAGDIGPRQWPKAAELIVQNEGKPHVAPVSDSRPALDIRPIVDDFQSLA